MAHPQDAHGPRLVIDPLGDLYFIDLPASWRMPFIIVRADGKPYVYVLEIVEHGAYSKWFPGRNR